jgi:eukaryotic-like serine/threonine-protein kinase
MPHASEVGVTATLTESQQVTGTLPYMAPEQLRGDPVEARTDIWAARAVLYEIATAHRPFEQKIPSALTDDIIHSAPRPPRSLRPALSPKLGAVILKCLEKEPAHRYQSAQELQNGPGTTQYRHYTDCSSPTALAHAHCSRHLVGGLGCGGVFYFRYSPKLTEKDTIVLADFENKTGGAVFDERLKQSLAVDLEQSPYLNVVSNQSVATMLKLMGREPDHRVTGEFARKLCQRLGSEAMLAGAIAKLGSQYVLGLDTVNCATGESLVTEQARAQGKEQVRSRRRMVG